MKLVRDLKKLKTKYIIISGDGRGEFTILRKLSERYNGEDKILWFPILSSPRKSGLKALDAVKILPSKYNITSIIYIVDGEFFEKNTHTKIQEQLKSIGIGVVDIQPIQKAFLVKCRVGPHNIFLYCIISGPDTFIEEEIAYLIDLELNTSIDLSGNRDANWKKRVKAEINHILHKKHLNLKKLIGIAKINNLERAFPNICAVLREIEDNF